MQKGGKVDEAFRALKEFADLCPDQDEIRLMLAEQLTKADRKTEAIEQLQTLHERYDSEGRASEAAATAARMRSIDPKVEPRSSGGGRRKTSSGDLIFIDLDTPSGSGSYTRPLTPPTPRTSCAGNRSQCDAAPVQAPEPDLDSSWNPLLESESEPEIEDDRRSRRSSRKSNLDDADIVDRIADVDASPRHRSPTSLRR